MKNIALVFCMSVLSTGFAAVPANQSNTSTTIKDVFKEDMRVEINQSFADRLINSSKWPLILDLNAVSSSIQDREIISLNTDQINSLSQALKTSSNDKSLPDGYKEIREILKAAETDAQKAVDALKKSKTSLPGMDLKTAQFALNTFKGEASEKQLSILKGKCWGIDLEVTRIRLSINKPDLRIGNQKFAFKNQKNEATIFVRITTRYWFLECKSRTKDIRLAGPLLSDGYANLSTADQAIQVKGHFDQLKIDTAPLRWLELSRFANKALDQKPLAQIGFDKFKQTIPFLTTTVGINRIQFLNSPNSLPISIETIAQ